MDPGGVESWLLNLWRNIDRERFQFDFCTFGRHAGLYAPEVEKLGAHVLRCPKGRNVLAFARRFRRILREGHYDVVHSHVHLFSGAVLRWAAAEGVPTRIVHSHTSQDDRPNTLARRGYRRVMRSWIDSYSTHGLAASKLAAPGLFGENWEADGRFRVLYYGIDLSPFAEVVDRDSVRRDMGIPPDAPVVGHVGRFVPPKNHQFLLDVAREILNRRSDIHFLLAGDGPLRPEMEARAAELGLSAHVHFTRTRTDIPRLLRGAMDAFVFPSSQEGLGLSVVEAQAAGLHCVVSDAVPADVAALPDSVEFLPLSGGSALWARRVLARLDMPRPDTDSVMRKLAQSRFSMADSIGGLIRIYMAGLLPAESLAVEQHA
jgi:glycosyltransferase involved in cell wall biosynthesis